ncbi:MAG: hypothetical protein P4M04_05455 [Acidobacteriota bacterium]|nr:hypothetical protein [Acidobacteriota bacterium]
MAKRFQSRLVADAQGRAIALHNLASFEFVKQSGLSYALQR